MFQPKDRFILESLFGKDRKISFMSELWSFPQLTLKEMIQFYIIGKRFTILKKYKKKNDKNKMRKSSLKGILKFRRLIRQELITANKLIKKVFGKKIKIEYILPLIAKINQFNSSQFKSKNDKEPSLFSRTFEVWAYNIIDKIASEYHWTIEYILDQKFIILLELMAVINNRNVGGKIDMVTASLAGHVGSGEVTKDLKDQFMKRKVHIPIQELRLNDMNAHKVLRSIQERAN